MELQLLREADEVLSLCGQRRSFPDGTTVVPFERKILMPMVLQPGASTVFTKEITGDTYFELRAISSDQRANQITGVRIQIQLPNGRFLIGQNGQDVGQFAWIGSWRYAIDPFIESSPGQKFNVILTDTVGLGAPFAMNLVFEGCDNYYLRGGRRVDSPSVADQPRYSGLVNENILAPCYVAGFGPAVPDDSEDSLFTYSSDLATLPIAGPLFTSLKIPIDAGYDFRMNRILVDMQAANTVTAGVVLGRLRAGGGYALNDDYIDLAQYLAAAEYPHAWTVHGQDAIYIDLQLVDGAGTGSVTWRAHLEGVRRRRVA